jgi:hypothetical protein
MCSWYSDRLGVSRGMYMDEGMVYVSNTGISNPQRPEIAQPKGPVPLEAGTGVVVLARLIGGRVERIRTVGDDCPMDAGGRSVYWLDSVTPAESVRFLAALSQAGPTDRSLYDADRRLAETAVRAIGYHRDAAADPALDRLAAEHRDSGVRRQAASTLTSLRTARDATVEFLSRLDANDEVGLLIFHDNVNELSPVTRVGDVGEGLSQRVAELIAGGNTALYEAVCQAIETTTTLQAKDTAAGETRLYGIILLSDGEDTMGTVTENQMFATCLPANAEADGVKIFPIAFGEAADQDVLNRIANVTGGQLFSADPASISNVYLSISAEQ